MRHYPMVSVDSRRGMAVSSLRNTVTEERNTVMLTTVRIKSLKPMPKPYKEFVHGGLYVYVTPKGAKSWR
jgi:hypothetical protein